MSAYEEYMEEKERIDVLLSKGFTIAEVQEDLDGATVQFQKGSGTAKEQLLLLTADARKYLSTLIFLRQKEA